MTDAIHPMRIVAERTGISPHVIRAWERRYGAVVPHRTDGNRRLYTQADIDRLGLLRRAVASGFSIAQLAKLSVDELKEVAGQPLNREMLSTGTSEQRVEQQSRSRGEYSRIALEAIRHLDPVRLELILSRAAVDEGRSKAVNDVIQVVLQDIGELWRRGEIRVCHEHLAAAVIRKVLSDLISHGPSVESPPVLVLATPEGTFHELGCLMAATAAVAVGWKSVYLGTSLPAEDIAAAAEQTRATVVGVSIVYPSGNRQISGELHQLRRELPSNVALLIGGRAARSYADLEGNVSFVESLSELERELALLSVPTEKV